MPRQLYAAVAICSLGSALQGWDNTGANGANLSFPKEFGIENNTWLIGVINAGPTLFGLLSAWASDPVNNLLGRRGTIFLTGLLLVSSFFIRDFVSNTSQCCLSRIGSGLYSKLVEFADLSIVHGLG